MGVSVGLSGCDRLSEKDKMDMIAKCDVETRKKITEEAKSIGGLQWSTVVETHYSFSDQRCYVLETRMDNIPSTSKTLYDGLTKRELLYVTYGKNGAGYPSIVTGSLASDDGKGFTVEDGLRVIEERMNRP